MEDKGESHHSQQAPVEDEEVFGYDIPSPPGTVPKSIRIELLDRRESLDLYNLSSSSSGEESGYATIQTEVKDGDTSTVAPTPAAATPNKDALQLLMQSRKPAQIVGGSRIPLKGHNKRGRDSPPAPTNLNNSNPNKQRNKQQKGEGRTHQSTSLS